MRRQVISTMTQNSCFDAEGNVVGDDCPNDYKRYWAGLTDTERAFETLANTDAAQFMAFWDKIEQSIPKPHIAP